jgi:hypothetical protein
MPADLCLFARKNFHAVLPQNLVALSTARRRYSTSELTAVSPRRYPNCYA